MNFTSTMKSIDDTKKALRCCSGKETGFSVCTRCPYLKEGDCIERMCEEALEYIEQLESRNIKPLASSIRLRLWRLFHPLKWRKMKKLRLDEMHEYTGIKVLPLNRR